MSSPVPDSAVEREVDAKPTESPTAAPPAPADQTSKPPKKTEPAATAPSEPALSPSPREDSVEDDEKEEDEREEGEADEDDEEDVSQSGRPQAADAQPPLPAEPVPGQQQSPGDDGWDYTWHPEAQRYYFFNRLTGETTWENPRMAASSSSATEAVAGSQPPAPPPLPTVAGGYNPAIHGDYDTWYAQNGPKEDEAETLSSSAAAAGLADPSLVLSGAAFNRMTGRFQRPDQGDEARSRRQMNGLFDVDAAANAHDGKSLKAERSGKRLTKGELKHFREKRKAKREEKKRAWLRD